MVNAASYYLRNPDSVCVGTAEHYLFIQVDGRVVELPTQHPTQWSQLMQLLMVPTRGDVLYRQLAGPLAIDPVDLLALREQDVLLEASTPGALETRRAHVFTANQGYHCQRGPQHCAHLVMALTGSILAGLMAPVILSLCYAGFHGHLDLILTAAALRFTTRDFFGGYGIRTWVDPFERQDGIHVPHIALGQSADCLLVMPASAACCQRLAEGACSDLLSLTVAAATAPVIIAPAMNTAMWNHPAVQRNVARLREDGMYVIEPTLIFSAAELVHHGTPMYGGLGTFWRGAVGVMHTLIAVMNHQRRCGSARSQGTRHKGLST
jgi:flavoprotein